MFGSGKARLSPRDATCTHASNPETSSAEHGGRTLNDTAESDDAIERRRIQLGTNVDAAARREQLLNRVRQKEAATKKRMQDDPNFTPPAKALCLRPFTIALTEPGGEVGQGDVGHLGKRGHNVDGEGDSYICTTVTRAHTSELLHSFIS